MPGTKAAGRWNGPEGQQTSPRRRNLITKSNFKAIPAHPENPFLFLVTLFAVAYLM
jgi:hypothetical protein